MFATILFGSRFFCDPYNSTVFIFRFKMQISHKYTMNLRIIGEMGLKKTGFG